MLANAQVIEASAERYAQSGSLPFARRLIEAMKAGEVAGGDKRGKQSAALLIYASEEYPALDLGPSLGNAMIAIGITATPIFIRLARGQVIPKGT
jgi:hypothetical protein